MVLEVLYGLFLLIAVHLRPHDEKFFCKENEIHPPIGKKDL
jgi:hypothetical protein